MATVWELERLLVNTSVGDGAEKGKEEGEEAKRSVLVKLRETVPELVPSSAIEEPTAAVDGDGDVEMMNGDTGDKRKM
jgi:hypothetical protein